MHDQVSEIGELSASPRIFDNNLLDRLSRVHPVVPVLVYAPATLVLLFLAGRHLSGAAIALWLAAGYLIWTLTEYWGHRYAFHTEFPGRLGARLHFLIHGVHHFHPSDPLRLVMPPLLSGPIMLAAFALLSLAFGPVLVLPVMAGFILGYLAYDMLHFHMHNRMPRLAVTRMLRRHHMLHHFRDSTRGFGVSAPWWDHVFGTAPGLDIRPAAGGPAA